MNGRRRFLAFSTLLAAMSWVQANAESPLASNRRTSLPLAADLAGDGRIAGEHNIPVLVLFSLPGCPYCEAVRRSFLRPLLIEPVPRALIRQVDIDSSLVLKDFRGQSLSHQAFAAREGIVLTPVVGFYGPAGEQVAARLIGAMLPDFYGSYLDDALGKAAAQIRAIKSKNHPGVDHRRLAR